MAYKINVPEHPYAQQQVTLGDQPYILITSYKERTKRFYLTIRTTTGDELITEKKIVPGLMTGLHDLGMNGDVVCERVYGTDDYPTWGTLGVGKPFELQWLTSSEVNSLLDFTLSGEPVEKRGG